MIHAPTSASLEGQIVTISYDEDSKNFIAFAGVYTVGACASMRELANWVQRQGARQVTLQAAPR